MVKAAGGWVQFLSIRLSAEVCVYYKLTLQVVKVWCPASSDVYKPLIHAGQLSNTEPPMGKAAALES